MLQSRGSLRTGCQGWLPWFVRRRVSLSAGVISLLIVLEIIEGVRPREFHGGYDLVSSLATGMILVGLAIRSWAAGTLIKNRSLTTTGPYKLVRNPLYTGSFLMMFGGSLLIDDPLPPLVVVVSLMVIYVVAVRSEERSLAKRFGKDWIHYACSTPRFLPRSLNLDFSGWSKSQWLHNREYSAVLATVAAFVALEIWEQM